MNEHEGSPIVEVLPLEVQLPLPTPAPGAVADVGILPVTGGDIATWLLLAALLLTIGVVALGVGRHFRNRL